MHKVFIWDLVVRPLLKRLTFRQRSHHREASLYIRNSQLNPNKGISLLQSIMPWLATRVSQVIHNMQQWADMYY